MTQKKVKPWKTELQADDCEEEEISSLCKEGHNSIGQRVNGKNRVFNVGGGKLIQAVKGRYSPDLKATAGQRLYQEISGPFVPIWTGRAFYSQDLKQFRGMFLQDERIAPTMNALRDGSDIRRIRHREDEKTWRDQ
ncbi:LOW QUALITY PROTEIN: hypothetical protein CIRG_05431 [Coccidioides immitis RMSCC 2394]|uniref:Uncharacterized protein n=1 Tax=Coccidioides immitis RMSCC 2394 TaxID=404692 RepID=A0A0J6YDJ2_COCIT|nr:LOW QUALITY PROTEIN: hypothetical protein CIRG_05431 [Coccidioides immitis RMSCC 2394]